MNKTNTTNYPSPLHVQSHRPWDRTGLAAWFLYLYCIASCLWPGPQMFQKLPFKNIPQHCSDPKHTVTYCKYIQI